ncbi:hypothetical protein [Tenacibaculum amylolyticum]|uniref:hypothetical protein n=1 Tax=Tenacibaculum amylolyticum TaxID=104269 RepID=UPI0038967F3F
MKKLLRLICRWLCGSQPEPTKPKVLLTYEKVVRMLKGYDDERFEMLVKNLGFEDSRVNTFDFKELKNYMTFTEKLAKEKNIEIKGVSFIKAIYTEETAPNEEFIGYENLLYTPTTIINGKEVQIDLLNSTRDNIVTFKEMLEKYGYKWRYNNRKNFKLKSDKSLQEKQEFKSMIMSSESDGGEESFVANYSHLAPPHD